MGFFTTIIFLFCFPDLDTLFALDAPLPFVQVYALALGKGPSIFMTVIAVVGLVLVIALPQSCRSVIDTALLLCTGYFHRDRRSLPSRFCCSP